MKPPVDAPASSASCPATSMPNVVNAWSSFSPPRPDVPRRWSLDDDRFRVRDQPRHLDRDRATDEHPAGLDQGAGFDPALGESSPHEFGIESPAGTHDRDVDGASCRWPRSPSWRWSSWPWLFLAVVFLAPWSSWQRSSWPVRLLGGGLLGSGLLGRGLLGRVFLAVVFLAGGLLGGGLLRRALLGRGLLGGARGALGARHQAFGEGLEPILEPVELLAQPADLLGDFALDQRASVARSSPGRGRRAPGRPPPHPCAGPRPP